MKWTDNGGGSDFEPVAAGTYLARCYQIIDLGTKDSEYNGETKKRRQVFIGFELPAEPFREWKDKDGNVQCAPQSVGEFYTMSLSEKANLRHVLESWRGRPFTPEELSGFDPRNILGAPAMLSVIHKAKKAGGVKAVIASIAKPMRGMTCLDAINKPVYFSLDEFKQEEFDAVPDGFRKIIMGSDEWKAINGAAPVSANIVAEEVDGDIPF